MSKGEGSGEGVGATLVSNTFRYISLADLARGWGLLLMDLCACVSEERRDGEGALFFMTNPYLLLRCVVQIQFKESI